MWGFLLAGITYVRHRPERTLLYQLVEAYYPSFLTRLAVQGTALPGRINHEVKLAWKMHFNECPVAAILPACACFCELPASAYTGRIHVFNGHDRGYATCY